MLILIRGIAMAIEFANSVTATTTIMNGLGLEEVTIDLLGLQMIRKQKIGEPSCWLKQEKSWEVTLLDIEDKDDTCTATNSNEDNVVLSPTNITRACVDSELIQPTVDITSTEFTPNNVIGEVIGQMEAVQEA